MLAVELANEPHTSDNYERKAGLQPGSLIKAWSCEMAQYIKSIDSNHMVTCSSRAAHHAVTALLPASYLTCF